MPRCLLSDSKITKKEKIWPVKHYYTKGGDIQKGEAVMASPS
jgi:hypothetical protein